MRNVPGIVTTCLLILVVGCGRKSGETAMEKALEKALELKSGGEAQVDISEDGVSIRTAGEELIMTRGKAAKLPADFPSDVLVYKKARIETAVQSGSGTMLSLRSKDDPAKIIAAYKDSMSGDGWTQQTSMDMGSQQMAIFAKDDRITTVVVSPDDDSTVIGLTLARR
ncbi:MAG: hypothetical protein HQ559_18630 [Lentisphaerae bacterium]|nr:hypothetical protein [Lentisphaerota bacterium]